MSRRKRDRQPKVSLQQAIGVGFRQSIADGLERARQPAAERGPRRSPLASVRAAHAVMADSLADQLTDDEAAELAPADPLAVVGARHAARPDRLGPRTTREA